MEGEWLVEQATQGDGVRCYNWRLDPKQNQEIACSEPTENMRQRALAFTAVQQQLLFEGKTKQFMDYKP